MAFKVYDNGFLGYHETSIYERFSGTDTKLEFLKSIEKFGKEWYYADLSKVGYKRNENGHRSNSLNSLNKNNYILVTGCSHTEGIGLEEDKRYGNLLANYLGTDFYNLALGGSGQDAVFFNLLNWKFTVKEDPKLIIYQLPNDARFLRHISIHEREVDYEPCTISSQDIHYLDKFLFLGDTEEVNYWESKKTLIMRNINKMFDCPIITINFRHNIKNKAISPLLSKNDLTWDFIDTARDDRHPGIKSNADITQKIINLYKSL